MIDTVVLAVPVYIVEIVLGSILYSRPLALGLFSSTPSASSAARIIFNLLAAAAGILYGALLIGYRGQTVGMGVVGVRAVDKASAQPLSMSMAWRRQLTLYVMVGLWTEIAFIMDVLVVHQPKHPPGTLVFFVGLVMACVTYLWPLGNPSNQTLQDKSAGSVVIRKG